MNRIIPSILTDSFAEFSRQLSEIVHWPTPADYVQLDIMDGQFVSSTSFPEREEINALDLNVPLELHLMVSDPLAEIKRFEKVKNIFRAVFHIEATNEPEKTIEYLKEINWEAGIAVNPETPLEKVLPYLDQVKEVMFMTVNSGQQGSPFLPDVGSKVKKFSTLKKRPLCAIDGAVNAENLLIMKSWGADIFCAGSAVARAENPYLAYQQLTQI